MNFLDVIVSNLPFLVTILVLVLVGGYGFWFFFVKNFKKFSTHEIVAISNKHYVDDMETGEKKLKLYRYQHGGEAVINPFTQSYKILPANKIVLEIESKEVKTSDDFFIDILTIIIFSIDSSSESQMEVAFEAFGNLATEEIEVDDFKKGVLEVLKPLVFDAVSTTIGKLTYETLIEEEHFINNIKDILEEKFRTMGLIITFASLNDERINNKLYIKQLKISKEFEIEKILKEQEIKVEHFKFEKKLEQEKYYLENRKKLLEQKLELERFEIEKKLEQEKELRKQKIDLEKYNLEQENRLLLLKKQQEFEIDKMMQEHEIEMELNKKRKYHEFEEEFKVESK